MNIAAISTAPGMGGIAVIRISGPDAIGTVSRIFHPAHPGHNLDHRPSHSLTFGRIIDGDEAVDDVVVALFRAPHSFTGEDVAEVSCHGSTYIQQRILTLLFRHGCRMAEPGEFTRRAFRNGKMDLTQAEATCDLIAATTAAAHRLALQQMRGGISRRLTELRSRLVEMSALLELELDFGEEDVEFADRSRLLALADELHDEVARLAHTFRAGNAIKTGLPVAIIGETNAGKSTLLNALLGDERAIVSDVHGTTRDLVEDTATLDGQLLRLVDTAGIRDTTDRVEAMGIERTYQRLDSAALVLWTIDGTRLGDAALAADLVADAIGTLSRIRPYLHPEQRIVLTVNKADLVAPGQLERHLPALRDAVATALGQDADAPTDGHGRNALAPLAHTLAVVVLSAKHGTGLDALRDVLRQALSLPQLGAADVVISNVRHFQALSDADAAILRARAALAQGLPADLVAQDLRQCAFHLGTIVGTVTTDELLGTIFSRFCIGK